MAFLFIFLYILVGILKPIEKGVRKFQTGDSFFYFDSYIYSMTYKIIFNKTKFDKNNLFSRKLEIITASSKAFFVLLEILWIIFK